MFPAGTFTWQNVSLIVMTLTAGTALIMWLGELITQRGIGNGMSILIFVSVISRLPSEGYDILKQGGTGKFTALLLLGVAIIVAVVFIEQGQRRIPVQFAKRVVGRRMYGGQSTYIPLKVNQAGVIPIIFASSVLYFPILLTNVLPADGFGATVQRYVRQPRAARLDPVRRHLRLLIIGFAYFYTAIAFDPAQQADIIRKQGGFIPGIRPGRRPSATWAGSSRASRCRARCSSPSSRCSRPCCSPSPTCRTSRLRAPRSSSPWASPSRR